MFVVTLRKGGLKKLAAVAICGAVLCGSVMGLSALMKDDEIAETAAVPKDGVAKIITAEEVSGFLNGYGVEIDLASAQVNAVKVPKKWDDSFKAFNDIIKEGGLDLSKSKGKKVDKWMALIPAMCQNDEKTYAVVLVLKEKPVGAYLIKKPSGDVSAIKSVQVGAPLTDEELAASADFDTEKLVVTDGTAPEAPVQGEAEATAPVQTVADGAVGALADAAPIDEATMPTE